MLTAKRRTLTSTKFKISGLQLLVLPEVKKIKNIFKNCLQGKDKSLYLHLLKQKE
jgi:hypothetical protein